MNEIAKDILIAPFNSPVILVLSVLYAIYESIRVYDARLLQAKTRGFQSAVAAEANGRMLPRWLGYIHFAGILMIIVLLIMNWKYAIALYSLLFLLRVLPVLERIGAAIMSRFLE